MVRGGRLDAVEFALRVNAAATLLDAVVPQAQAARAIAEASGVSIRQARRYVERAMAQGRARVPEASVVFTVKLPTSLAARVREHAHQGDSTISAVVAGALEQFLSRQGPSRPPGP